MDDKTLDVNNEEFKNASTKEYYDKWMEPYMGYDYTKITKDNAKEYREKLREQYKKGYVDPNNQVEAMMNPYLNEMKELVDKVPQDKNNF